MKRIVIIENEYVRDTQVFYADPEVFKHDPDWDANFKDVRPSQYVGIFTGTDEEDIRKKAAEYMGCHTSILKLITFDPEDERVIVGRPVNGISINGLEYITGDKGDVKEFPNMKAARKFLREHGVSLEEMDELTFLNPETNEIIIQETTACKYEFDKLFAHVGHTTEVTVYGTDRNVSIECMDCYEVLYSVDNPDYGTEGE